MSKLSELLNEANRLGWSMRAIEAEAQKRGHQVTYTTISKYMNGKHGTPTHSVLQALADVFGLDVNTLRDAASMPGVGEAFVMPAEAARLTADQRNAILHVVRVMLDDGPRKPFYPDTGEDMFEDRTKLPKAPRK